MALRKTLVAATAVALLGISIYPQTPATRSGIHVADLMSATEFRNAGLNKLSSDEMVALDSWLNSYLIKVVAKLAQPTTASIRSPAPSVIESVIDGEFNGWDGETIFKLTNGQIWQQSEYDYEYEYEYRPEVTIYKTNSGYKMQVKGMAESVAVKRIK
jgi:hypothetical protein